MTKRARNQSLARICVLLGALVACVTLSIFHDPILDSLMAVPLLLLVPGWYVTSRWDFFRRGFCGLCERAYWIVILSFGILVGTGFVLNIVAEISRQDWLNLAALVLCFFVVLELLVLLVGHVRTRREGLEHKDGEEDQARAQAGRALSWRIPEVRNIGLVLVSLSLLLGAIWLSVASNSAAGRERIVQVSFVPSPVRLGSYAMRGEIGVVNRTGARVNLEVRVYRGDQRTAAEAWTLRLQDGERWNREISRTISIPLEATVAYSRTASTPIASVSLGSPVHQKEGYWTAASRGDVFSYGSAVFYGSARSFHLKKPIVGMAATPDGHGYWLVASDGGIFSFGDANFYGSAGAVHLNKPVVGMAATPDGGGYWLVASDGGIFNYGDAFFYGSAGSIHLNKPIVGVMSTFDGGGYWLVASDGGIFNYGNAGFQGSAGSLHLNAPMVGGTPT
jgi:hypothetical protein